jgi:diguanylate cyclase
VVAAGEVEKGKKPYSPSIRGFAALVVASKKVFIVHKDLSKFCKKHNIAALHKNTTGLCGYPIQHRNIVYGAIVLEKVKDHSPFGRAVESLVALIAARLAVEIAFDRLVEEKNRLESEVEQLALFDPLTKIPNRRYFDLILEMEMRKAKGYSRQLSLAMIDLDHFRNLNARHGKKVGNELLIHVAQTLQRNVRATDFVARFGGEEFMIILPEALNEAAVNVAERIRSAVESAPLVLKGTGRKKVTISIGVVTYPSSAENLPALLEQANRALKKAKGLGRNQVVAI